MTQDLNLHQSLAQAFSLGELDQLCADLGIDPESIQYRERGKETYAMWLVIYLQQNNQLSRLVGRCAQLRPDVLWATLSVPPVPSARADDRLARAERKIDEGRQKVQQWGERISQSGWDEQAWHLLGFALQLTHEAVEIDPDYQRAWTLMADVYHRIGKEELAKKCLGKSYALATPGPNHPGRFYRDVERNIRSGYPFNSAGRLTRQLPPSWFEAKYQRYWTL